MLLAYHVHYCCPTTLASVVGTFVVVIIIIITTTIITIITTIIVIITIITIITIIAIITVIITIIIIIKLLGPEYEECRRGVCFPLAILVIFVSSVEICFMHVGVSNLLKVSRFPVFSLALRFTPFRLCGSRRALFKFSSFSAS